MGGIERSSSNLANYLYLEGFNVLFLAIFKHPKFLPLIEGIEFDEPEDGTNIHNLSFWRTIKRLRSKIKAFDPEVVLVYNQFYAAISLISLTGLKYKIFTSDRASPSRKWPFSQRLLIKTAFCINPPMGIIAQTTVAACNQAKKVHKKTRIEVIPNILREVKTYPEIKRKHWVLGVGRFNDHAKGFDRLIEGFAMANPKDWKLVFAGGDEQGIELKQLAQKLGVLEKIIFLGKVVDIDKVYAQAGMFVIPSRREGFPNALCEAMAAGLPCISFDFIAGPQDLIDDGINGIIVENGNIKALADAIINLTNDADKRRELGDKAKNITNRLNKNIIGAKVIDFLFDNKI